MELLFFVSDIWLKQQYLGMNPLFYWCQNRPFFFINSFEFRFLALVNF